MNQLVEVNSTADILPQYQGTAISLLLEYHNLNRPFDDYTDARMLVGMCMDNRKSLRIPDNFAYILRTGGGNLRNSEFKVSYAIGVGNMRIMALLAHNQCGMVNLAARQDEFIEGLVRNAGWTHEQASEHFNSYAPMFEIENAIDFVVNESSRLNRRYPGIVVAPLYYRLEDNKLLQIVSSEQ